MHGARVSGAVEGMDASGQERPDVAGRETTRGR
jgi:hypothetical protein